MTVEAVLFDADGVLQHQDVTLHSLLTGVLSMSPEEAESRYHEVWEAESPILTGKGNFEEDDVRSAGEVGQAGPYRCFRPGLQGHTDRTRPSRASSGICAAKGSCAVSPRTRCATGRATCPRTSATARLFDREFYSCDIGTQEARSGVFPGDSGGAWSLRPSECYSSTTTRPTLPQPSIWASTRQYSSLGLDVESGSSDALYPCPNTAWRWTNSHEGTSRRS